MKSILNFLKTTLIGGVLFLLPVVLSVFLLHKALHWIAGLVKPVAKLLSIEDVVGVRMEYLLAAVILVLVGFLAGLVARTALGKKLRDSLENFVLRKVPGYNLMKGLSSGDERQSNLRSALVQAGSDKWQLGFIIERRADGWCTVFTPSAPSATSGSVHFLSSEQVKEINVSGTELIKVIMKIGEGFGDIAANEVKRNATQ